MKTRENWVRLYVRANRVQPVKIGSDSLECLIDFLTSKGETPELGFSWDRGFSLGFSETKEILGLLSEKDRCSINHQVETIEGSSSADRSESPKAENGLYFRFDFVNASGDTASGAVVHVEQKHKYVGSGMVSRTLLGVLRRETGLDLTKPGTMTLATMHKKLGWLASSECPRIYDDYHEDVTDELKRAVGIIHYDGKPNTRVDWL